MKNSGYPNIEWLVHLVDHGLGLVFALIRVGVYLLMALILIGLIAFVAAPSVERSPVLQVQDEVRKPAIEEWLATNCLLGGIE